MYGYIKSDYLCHHGIKGQKWGVRRYQNKDGTRTAAGKRRYYVGEGKINSYKDVKKQKSTMSKDEYKKYVNTYLFGKNEVDRYLKTGTNLSRIQKEQDFNKDYAFYATHKKHDKDMYSGLFGKNLQNRAKYSGEENPEIYQLQIKNTQKLKMPSDQNAANITRELLKDDEFKNNLRLSIEDSKSIMKRPSQQVVFNKALHDLDQDKISNKGMINMYQALNITLVNHQPFENEVQNRFYSELKKNGYSAIIDVNDQKYSSYHAKQPVIVFDTDKVKLQSVMKMDSQQIDKLYSYYNTERIVKDTIYNLTSLPAQTTRQSMNYAQDYVNRKTDNYLND